MKYINIVLPYSIALSRIYLIFAVWSLVPLPFLNPACSSDISLSVYVASLPGIILSTTLLAWGINAMILQLEHSLRSLFFLVEVKIVMFSTPGATNCFSKYVDIVLLELLYVRLNYQGVISLLQLPPIFSWRSVPCGVYTKHLFDMVLKCEKVASVCWSTDVNYQCKN